MTPEEAKKAFEINATDAAAIAPCFDSPKKMKAIHDLLQDPENLDLLWDADFEDLDGDITAVLTRRELEALAEITLDPENLDVIDDYLTQADPELALRLFG